MITTLGTPFIDVMSAIMNRIARQRRVMNAIAWCLFAAIVIGFSLIIIVHAVQTPQFENILIAIFMSFIFFALALMVYFKWRRRQRLLKQSGWTEYWSAPLHSPFMLCISSPMDEAWQVLHHMPDIPDPFAPKARLIAYLWEATQSQIARSSKVARTYAEPFFGDLPLKVKLAVGTVWLYALASVPSLAKVTLDVVRGIGPLGVGEYLLGLVLVPLCWLAVATYFASIWGISYFYSAVLSPARWLARRLQAAILLPTNIGTYIALRRMWQLLQQKALGLDGYHHEIPLAQQIPKFASPAIYKYQDLPRAVVQRALGNREKWMTRTFGAVTETFSTLAKLTTDDFSSLMKIIETDPSLVHAAYYNDDECIDMIADWIAGTALKSEIDSPSSAAQSTC